ncbi:cell division protein FtsA [Natranaerofaba carboxydovora]|uniref:cell division protein FtsA n=1 Tax=Natranaerofaba carboxydovora TaxID=2742683 RepID=UPI001F130BEF|nr:cell division protein FtsA [Natranaerofaba carboxydovora]UMZ73262.1 Cell division protein FtsA [Natranaerofaba carboxydovora]
MTRKSLITSLDVGTTYVRAIIGEERSPNEINIIGIGTSPSKGMKEGGIIDLEKTIEAIEHAVEQAERMSGVEVHEVFVNVVASHVNLINNKGVVAVNNEDREITAEDVERVTQAAKVVNLPPDKEIIDVIPHQFIVDGYDGIKDPVGMLGVRLEVDALIVAGKSTTIHNLLRCVQRAGLEVNDLILSIMANAETLLSEEERKLGVGIIDIGGGTVEIGIFKDGFMECLDSINIGGDYITNDLAVGLKISQDEAEKLKIKFGVASPELAEDGSVEIFSIGDKEPRQVSIEEVGSIIEPRIREIFDFINSRLDEYGYREKLAAGIVITGGVTELKGLQEIAEQELDANVRIVKPRLLGVNNPIYSTGVGMIQYVVNNNYESEYYEEASSGNVSGLFNRIKNWFLDFFE